MMVQMKTFYFAKISLGDSSAGNRHTIEICNGLAHIGQKVTLFTPFSGSNADLALNSAIEHVQIPLKFSPTSLMNSILFYLLVPYHSFRHFRQVVPEIVYVRASFLDIIAFFPLKYFFNFKLVAELNGIRSLETEGGRVKKSLVSMLENFSFRMYDGVISVTSELQEWAYSTKIYKTEQLAVISNGVDIEQFQPVSQQKAKQELGLDESITYLNFTSSLKPWHDTRILIEMLPHLLRLEVSKPFKLLIVGDGPERGKLSALAKKLDVENHIDWVGLTPSEKIPTFINASTICLAPFPKGRNQITGISPVKIYEYMACGRPFITNRLDLSYDEWVKKSQAAIVVEQNTPYQWAKAVSDLLSHPNMVARLGDNGRKTAEKSYSWSKMAEKTDEFLQMIVSQS